MKNLLRLLVLIAVGIMSTSTASADEDDIYVCHGGGSTTCSQAYVTCVGRYGGQLDPGGSGMTLCEARYQGAIAVEPELSVRPSMETRQRQMILITHSQ